MRRFQLQWLLVAATAFACALAAAATQPLDATPQKGTKVNGHIVRIQGTNQVVVRTADKREVILHTNPQTQFILRNNPVIFTDVREGAPVEVVYDVTGEQNLAGTFMIGSAELVEGDVVRVVEPENQLILRTTAGKEVIFVTEPATSFTFDNRFAQLRDFQPGTHVRVHFDVRNQQTFAHSVWTMPKRTK